MPQRECDHLGQRAAGYANNGIGFGFRVVAESPEMIKQIRPFIGKLGQKTLQSFSNIFIFVGAISGTGLGYYLMKKDIEKMVETLYEYFKEHAGDFSNSFDQAIQYLEDRIDQLQD